MLTKQTELNSTPDLKPRAPSLDANPLKREGNLRNMSGGNDLTSVNAAINTTSDFIEIFLKTFVFSK